MASAVRKRKISFADLEATLRPRLTGAPPTGHPAQNVAAQPPPPQATQSQQDMQRREEIRRRENAYRQARKPTDRNISDDIAAVVIGDGVERYRKLRAVERRLDAAMMQKRLDVADSFVAKEHATLRIWVSNTAEGQPWQIIEDGSNGLGDDPVSFEFGDNSQASYRVKIQGRLLDDASNAADDDEDDPMDQDDKPTADPHRPRLSQFFNQITIDFDRAASLQPDNFTSIEWKRSTMADPDAEFDCLEFERKGDEEIHVTISLIRREAPERYKLSKPMANLVHAETADRATVVAGIWEYVRANGLQEEDENRKIVCDDKLKAVFGMETLYFPYMPELIHHHLSPLDPIKIPYTIRVDKPYLTSPDGRHTIYDLQVPQPSKTQQTMNKIVSDPQHTADLKSIIAIDSDIALLVSKMNNIDGKRQFYDSLARDPTGFIKRWMSSQQRDLDIVLAEGGRGVGDTREDGLPMEVFRKGGADGVWGGDLARESVGLWLARSKARQH